MATINKRKWTNKSGEHEAWVLAYTDANGKRHKEQFKLKRQADARRVQVESQIDTGVFREGAKTKTVADACASYLEALSARHLRDAKVTTTYLKTNQGEVFNYIAPEVIKLIKKDKDGNPISVHDKIASRVTPFPADKTLGHFRLAQFTSADVIEYTERLLEAGLTVSTARRLVATLSRILAHAIGKNWVAINVAKGVKVIGSRKEAINKRITPPAKDDLTALLQAAKKAGKELPGLYVKILFAAFSGLRASEQWALRWGDLDLEGCKVNVTKRLDYHGSVDTTKSTSGTRTVPIAKDVAKALKGWKGEATETAIVFPNSRGGHTGHGNFLKRTFDPFKIEAGLPTLTWHALRHFAISTWIEAELKPKVVQTFAGHKTMAITMDRYGHLFPSDDHSAAMDKIADSLL